MWPTHTFILLLLGPYYDMTHYLAGSTGMGRRSRRRMNIPLICHQHECSGCQVVAWLWNLEREDMEMVCSVVWCVSIRRRSEEKAERRREKDKDMVSKHRCRCMLRATGYSVPRSFQMEIWRYGAEKQEKQQNGLIVEGMGNGMKLFN